MNNEESLKLANQKIDHEHSRWNTWVIFFFGSIVSVFTLWGQVKGIVPIYVPCILGALISLMWIFIALGIRRVSASWVKVIVEVEGSDLDDFKPNQLYKDFEIKHKICKDFFDFSLFRVTKVLTYAGVISFILFIVLGLFSYNQPTKKLNPTIEIKDIATMVESIQTISQQVDNINQTIVSMESELNNISNKVEKYNKANSADAKSSAAD